MEASTAVEKHHITWLRQNVKDDTWQHLVPEYLSSSIGYSMGFCSMANHFFGARKKPQKSKKFPNAILRDAPWYIMVKSRVPQQVLVSSFIMLSTPADRQNHITIIIKSNIKIHFTLNFLGLPGTQKHGNKIIPRHFSNHCRLWFCSLNPGSSKMISSGSCSTLPFGRVHFTSE